MIRALLGKKIGMTQVFDDSGTVTPVTVLQVGPCFVTQVKSQDKDNTVAVQIGFDERKKKNTPRPLLGHFDRAGVTPKKVLMDVEVADDAEPEPGQVLDLSIFEGVERVHVSGVSKGRGFAGVIKRHGFRGGPATHGSKTHRRPGSIGAGSSPGHVIKGHRMAGHMGAAKVTVHSLRVVKLYPARNLMLVKGAVPGGNGGYIVVSKA